MIKVLRSISLLLLCCAPFAQATSDRASACQAWMSKVGQLSPGTIDSVRISPCLEQNLQMIIEAERIIDAYRVQLHGQSSELAPSPAVDNLLVLLQADTKLPDLSVSYMKEDIEPRQAHQLKGIQQRLLRDRLLIALRLALLSGERDIAIDLANELQTQMTIHKSWANSDPELLSLDRVSEIQRILTGEQGPTHIQPVSAPQSPWLDRSPRFIGCAGVLKTFPERELWRDLPSEIDAYLAVGESGYALNRYLNQEWVDSMSGGALPERMREIAEHVFGKQHAGAEFEAALSSLRVNQGPVGPNIEIYLFGQWLPIVIPVVWRDDTEIESSVDAHGTVGPESIVAGFDIRIDEIAESLRANWAYQDINREIQSFERKIGRCSPELNALPYRQRADRIRSRFGANAPRDWVIRFDRNCPRPEFFR